MTNSIFKNYSGKGKIIINIELITLEPLHIGASEKSVKVNESDLLCIKRNDGKPVIPGSSMRGMLRAYINRISEHLKDPSMLKKLGLSDLKIEHQGINKEDIVCDLQGIFSKIGTKKNPKLEQIAIDDDCICDICLLFGAKGYGTPLKVTDFEPEGQFAFINRNHIAIDIESDTTQRKALFFVESVAEDTIFKGKLMFEKRDHSRQTQVMKLLEILLNYLKNQELYLGGLKSRGYGLVKCTKIEIQEYTMEDEILGNQISPVQI